MRNLKKNKTPSLRLEIKVLFLFDILQIGSKCSQNELECESEENFYNGHRFQKWNLLKLFLNLMSSPDINDKSNNFETAELKVGLSSQPI